MKTLCGTLLAFAVALLAAPEAFTAAPSTANQNKKGHVFKGVVVSVQHGKKGHGTIVVRGHNSGQNQKVSAGNKNNKGSNREMTFHVNRKTVFVAMGGKGGTHKTSFSHVRAGEHVGIEHHGHHADEVIIVHHKKKK